MYYSPKQTFKLREMMLRYNRNMSYLLVRSILDQIIKSNCQSELEEAKVIAKELTKYINGRLRQLPKDTYTYIDYTKRAKSVLTYVMPPKDEALLELWMDDVVRHYIPFASIIYEMN